ncbi:MAG: cell division protein FtsA [Candidatus Liptonbacteria bacterium]|nr:cell division protein FtsA [Candidatus Liptonbacteria bacterium]
MATHFLVGLDVGTSAIKVAVAERQKDGRPILRSVFKEPSAGLRRGVVVDIGEASQAISRALKEVRKFSRRTLSNLYVSVGSPQINAEQSRGIAAVSRVDAEIYQDDVDRVVRASQALTLGQNRMILHNVIREFIVDGVGDITDPLGLSGNRLELNTLIVNVFTPHVKSLMRAIELGGGQVGGLVLGPLAASRAVLSKSQKDLGVVLIDVGFGTTAMSVYEEDKLIGTSIFPVGAGNITKDLAVGLKISVPIAENLKVSCGYAIAREVSMKESVELSRFLKEAKEVASRRFIAEIIESRLAEICEFVNNELKSLGKSGRLPGGATLVGGGAKLPGLTALIKRELKLSSQIGVAIDAEWATDNKDFSEFFEDPEFVTAFGLILWGTEQERWRPMSPLSRFSVKNIVRYFLP